MRGSNDMTSDQRNSRHAIRGTVDNVLGLAASKPGFKADKQAYPLGYLDGLKYGLMIGGRYSVSSLDRQRLLRLIAAAGARLERKPRR
jgi:hypothetical protein